MRVCKKCGFENEDYYSICIGCGEKFSEEYKYKDETKEKVDDLNLFALEFEDAQSIVDQIMNEHEKRISTPKVTEKAPKRRGGALKSNVYVNPNKKVQSFADEDIQEDLVDDLDDLFRAEDLYKDVNTVPSPEETTFNGAFSSDNTIDKTFFNKKSTGKRGSKRNKFNGKDEIKTKKEPPLKGTPLKNLPIKGQNFKDKDPSKKKFNLKMPPIGAVFGLIGGLFNKVSKKSGNVPTMTKRPMEHGATGALSMVGGGAVGVGVGVGKKTLMTIAISGGLFLIVTLAMFILLNSLTEPEKKDLPADKEAMYFFTEIDKMTLEEFLGEPEKIISFDGHFGSESESVKTVMLTDLYNRVHAKDFKVEKVKKITNKGSYGFEVKYKVTGNESSVLLFEKLNFVKGDSNLLMKYSNYAQQYAKLVGDGVIKEEAKEAEAPAEPAQ